jgi:hypothetical protein
MFLGVSCFLELPAPLLTPARSRQHLHIPASAYQGWNEMLPKVGLGRFEASGTYGFTFRVVDARGKTIPGIASSTRPHELKKLPTGDKILC